MVEVKFVIFSRYNLLDKPILDSCNVNNGGCDVNAACFHDAKTNEVTCTCKTGYINTGVGSAVVCTGYFHQLKSGFSSKMLSHSFQTVVTSITEGVVVMVLVHMTLRQMEWYVPVRRVIRAQILVQRLPVQVIFATEGIIWCRIV
jgi:hypothetical protein